MQVSISICLIIKNEEKYLSRCLSSIKDIASEIIVVDTGSTDNSILIASQFTEHIYSYKWRNDFSSARNYCLDKASGKWILVLDGDEELARESLDLIKAKIRSRDVKGYLVDIKHMSKNTHELLDIPELQLRLFENNKNYRYRGIIHEQIMDSIRETSPSVQIEVARNISIIHYGYSAEDNKNRHRLIRNIELIEQGLDKKEEELLKHYCLGCEYYRHHKFAEALQHFQLVYEHVDPGASFIPDLLRSVSVSLYMLDRVAEALSFIDTALTILPDMGDLYYLQAIIYKNNSQYVKAYQAYKECLKVTDHSLHDTSIYCQHKDKVYFYMGGLAEYFMDKDSALFYFFESLKQNPYMLDSFRRMIAILNPRIDPQYTVNSLNRVFDLTAADVQTDLALIFYEEGCYNLVLDIITRLEDQGLITEHSRLIKGLCLLRNKQYSNAEAELQAICDNKLLYIMARQYLLMYYWLIQDFRKAAGCLKRIKNAGAEPATIYVTNLLIKGYAVKPNSVQDYYRLARQIMEVIVEIGDSNQIDDAFQNLAAIFGERPSRLLAEMYYKFNKFELAEKEFGYLLKTDSKDAQAFYYMGKSCWAQGNLHDAEKYLCLAIKKGLETPKIRWEVARLYQELTVESLTEGLKDCPDSEKMQMFIQDLKNNMIEV